MTRSNLIKSQDEDTIFLSKVGIKIKNLRVARGFTQTDLGNLIGVSFQQIQKYETAQNSISAKNLYDIAKACNSPISHFFETDINTFDVLFEKEILDEKSQVPKREMIELIKYFSRIDNNHIRKAFINLAAAQTKKTSNEEI